MFKKTSFYIITLLLGAGLVAAGFAFQSDETKSIAGVLAGIGAGTFGMSLSKLIMKRYEKKYPDIMKQNEIELRDERNTMIRSKAKSKSGDVLQWLVMGLAYIMILFNEPLWLILLTVGIFLSYNILSIYLMNKYQKEM